MYGAFFDTQGMDLLILNSGTRVPDSPDWVLANFHQILARNYSLSAYKQLLVSLLESNL